MPERAIPSPDRRYEAYTHVAMRAEVGAGNDPSAAGEIGQEWGELARRLLESTEELRHLERGSEGLWQGSAGEALRSVLAEAAGWSDRAARASAILGESVSRQAAIAARARDEMPEPVEYDPAQLIQSAVRSGGIGALIGLSEQLAARRAEAEAARQKAIDVMTTRDESLRAAVPDVTFTAPPSLTSSGPRPDSAAGGPVPR